MLKQYRMFVGFYITLEHVCLKKTLSIIFTIRCMAVQVFIVYQQYFILINLRSPIIKRPCYWSHLGISPPVYLN